MEVDWVCEDDTSTCDNKLCKIKTDGYCWDGKKFVDEKDLVDRALKYVATSRGCETAKGEFREGKCYCGVTEMDYSTQMCMDGIIQDSVKGKVEGVKVDDSMKEKANIQLDRLLRQK